MDIAQIWRYVKYSRFRDPLGWPGGGKSERGDGINV